MKKYVVGAVFGFLIAMAVGAHAEEAKKMIGEIIDGSFAVKIDGKELTDQAIVVQGTSYLPVRAVSEATGYDVSFDPNEGIELTKKNALVELENNPDYIKSQKLKGLQDKSEQLRKECEELYKPVQKYMFMEYTNPNGIDRDDYAKVKKAWEDKKAEYKAITDEIAVLTGRPQ